MWRSGLVICRILLSLLIMDTGFGHQHVWTPTLHEVQSLEPQLRQMFGDQRAAQNLEALQVSWCHL